MQHVLHVRPTLVADTRTDESEWSSLSDSEVNMSDETDDDEDLDEDQEIQDLSLVLENTILYSESDHDEEFVPLPERSDMTGMFKCKKRYSAKTLNDIMGI